MAAATPKAKKLPTWAYAVAVVGGLIVGFVLLKKPGSGGSSSAGDSTGSGSADGGVGGFTADPAEIPLNRIVPGGTVDSGGTPAAGGGATDALVSTYSEQQITPVAAPFSSAPTSPSGYVELPGGTINPSSGAYTPAPGAGSAWTSTAPSSSSPTRSLPGGSLAGGHYTPGPGA